MKHNIIFLNNKAMEETGVLDMHAAIEDVKNAYILNHKQDVINPGKCVLRWGKTVDDENVLGRINAMPGYIGGEYDMAGIKWIGSGPMNYKKGLPRASVTVILNDPETKLPVCVADGTAISTVRTGASGGVAIELLAKSNAEVMTICGAGAQAHTQLEAALISRPTLKKVYVYDIVSANADTLVGAGNVLCADACENVINAGVSFVVSPCFDEKSAEIATANSDADYIRTRTREYSETITKLEAVMEKV